MDPDAHEHECVLCDQKYKCDDYGCEDKPAGICKKCDKEMDGPGRGEE